MAQKREKNGAAFLPWSKRKEKTERRGFCGKSRTLCIFTALVFIWFWVIPPVWLLKKVWVIFFCLFLAPLGWRLYPSAPTGTTQSALQTHLFCNQRRYLSSTLPVPTRLWWLLSTKSWGFHQKGEKKQHKNYKYYVSVWPVVFAHLSRVFGQRLRQCIQE